jgi:cobalt-zinc-cadmium efflux system outer membrane protein
VEQAAAETKAAGVWANPSLSYDREEVFLSGRGTPENYVRVELPLEISGRRGLRVKGAELGVQAARASSEHARVALLLEAADTYWTASGVRELAAMLRHERETLGRVVESVRSRARAGDTSGYDLERLELELGTFDSLVAETERQREGLQRRLALLAGRPGERLEVSAALSLPQTPGARERLVEQALAARADHQAARLRVAQAERELAAARRGWVPTLVLAGGAKSATFGTETAWGYLAGLALSLPVLDHGQGEASRARARLALAQAQLWAIEAQVTSDVGIAHAAFTRVLGQAERFASSQLPRLDRLLRRAEISYQEGERPVFELLDAYRTARDIRQRDVELRQKTRLAENDLARALGRLPGEAP